MLQLSTKRSIRGGGGGSAWWIRKEHEPVGGVYARFGEEARGSRFPNSFDVRGGVMEEPRRDAL